MFANNLITEIPIHSAGWRVTKASPHLDVFLASTTRIFIHVRVGIWISMRCPSNINHRSDPTTMNVSVSFEILFSPVESKTSPPGALWSEQ